MSSLTFEPIAVPLREDDHGVIRVGNTRVLLDLVIYAFQNGASPEAIVDSYDALSLPDVYAVLGYYLRHPHEIDAYLHRRRVEASAVRQRIETSQPRRANLRDMLMARARAKGAADAPAD